MWAHGTNVEIETYNNSIVGAPQRLPSGSQNQLHLVSATSGAELSDVKAVLFLLFLLPTGEPRSGVSVGLCWLHEKGLI